jgi:hypothetical protein
MFDFSSLKKSVQSIAGQARDLRAQVENAKREREDITNAPVTREDVKAMVSAWAAGKSAEYVKRLHCNMQELIRDAKSLQDPKMIEHRMTLFGKTRQQGGEFTMFPGPELEDMAICCLLGPALVTALHAAIDRMDWPAGALPVAARVKAVNKLDAQIAELVAQEAELVTTARQAGIVIE